jgi:phosphoribosyl 1,2-cyclic phosphodiesterase
MKVKIWGCRGSIAVPGPHTVKYGGNTTCYEIRSESGELLIIDSGTGFRELGNALIPSMPLKAHIVFSHTHYDHVIGYPFFVPFFVPTNEFNLYGPSLFDKGFRDIMKELLSYSFFPVRLDELAAKLHFHDLKEEVLTMGPFTVETIYANHPVTTIAYRITCDGTSFVFSGDTEPYSNHLEGDPDADPDDVAEVEDIILEQNTKWLNFLNKADLVFYDSQYTPEEYPKFKGWGHTSMDVAIHNSAHASVKKLVMTHHDPRRTDEQLDALLLRWKDYVSQHNLNLSIDFAREGETYEV